MNLFDLFADDLEKASKPLSAGMLARMGGQIGRTTQEFVGLENSNLPSNIREEALIGGFQKTLDTPVDTTMYENFVYNAVNASVEGHVSRRNLNKFTDNEVFQSNLDKLNIHRGDFETAKRLSSPGTTLRDVASEFAHGMVYPSAIYGFEAEKHEEGSFAETSQSALTGALTGAISYDPSKGKFWNYIPYKQQAAVAQENRSIRRTFNDYGGMFEKNRDRAISALGAIYREQHAGEGPYAPSTQYYELARENIDEDPGLIGAVLGQVESDPQYSRWNYLERYIKQHGPISMPSSPWKKGEPRPAPSQMDLNMLGKAREQLEGKRFDDLSDRQKQMYDAVDSVYQGISAGGWGGYSRSTYNEDYMSSWGDREFTLGPDDNNEFVATLKKEYEESSLYEGDASRRYQLRKDLPDNPRIGSATYSMIRYGFPGKKFAGEKYHYMTEKLFDTPTGESNVPLLPAGDRGTIMLPRQDSRPEVIPLGSGIEGSPKLLPARVPTSERASLTQRASTVNIEDWAGPNWQYGEETGNTEGDRFIGRFSAAERIGVGTTQPVASRSVVAGAGDDLNWDDIEEVPFDEAAHGERQRLLQDATEIAMRGLMPKDLSQRQLIVGMAGTGKSELMARDAGERGAAGHETLFVTGTRSAKDTARQRLEKYGVGTDEVPAQTTTAHGLALTGLQRVRDNYGVPTNFSHKNIVSEERLFGLTSENVDQYRNAEGSAPSAFQSRLASGARNPEYIGTVNQYMKAFEYSMRRGHSPEDLADKTVMDEYVKQFNVAPDATRSIVGNLQDYFKQNDLVTFEGLIRSANAVARQPGGAEEMFGERYKTIALDEAHQFADPELELAEHTVRVNPDASVKMGTDPYQAPMWKFKGGGAEKVLASAQRMGMDTTKITDNYRLSAHAIDYATRLLGVDEKAVSTIDDREGRAESFLNMEVAKTSDQAIRSMLRNVSAGIEGGDSPSDHMIQTFTNKTADEIAGVAEDMGMGDLIWRRHSKEYYQAKMKYEGWSESDVQMAKATDVAPPGKVAIQTGHSAEGREAPNIHLLTKPGEYRTDTKELREETLSRLYTAGTRTAGEEGKFNIYASKRLPEVLEQFVEKDDARNIRSSDLDMRNSSDEAQFHKAFQDAAKDLGIEEIVGPKNAEIITDTSFQGTAAAKVNAKTTAEAAFAYAGEAMSEALNTIGKQVVEASKDSTGSRSAMGVVHDTALKVFEQARQTLGIGTGGTSGGSTGGPPVGGVDDFFGMSQGSADAPIASAQSGGGEGQPGWYQMSRAMWAARMATSQVKSAISQQQGGISKYGQFTSQFAPLAAMEGSVVGTPEGVAMQQQMNQLAWAQGSYEQWGGFVGDVNQGGAIPRMVAGLRPVGNILGAGAQGYIGASVLGFTGAATAIAGGTGAIAGGLVAGTVGMEAYNAFLKPEEDTHATWSKSIVSRSDLDAYKMSHSQELFDLYRQENNIPEGEGGLKYLAFQGFTPKAFDDWVLENAIKQDDPTLYSEFKIDDSLASRMRDTAISLAKEYSEDPSSTIGAGMDIVRQMPGLEEPEEYLRKVTDAGSKLLMGSSYGSALSALAQSHGYQPGTEEYTQWMTSNVDMFGDDIQASTLAIQEAGKVNQFASQIQPYFAGTGMGAKTITDYSAQDMPQAYVGAAAGVASLYSSLGYSDEKVAEGFGAGLYNTPQKTQAITNIGETMAGVYGWQPNLNEALLSNQYGVKDLNLANEILNPSTALRGMDWANQTGAYEGMFSGAQYDFFDRAGNPNYETDGMAWANWARAHRMDVVGGVEGKWSATGAIQNIFSGLPQEYAQSFASGGIRGLQATSAIRQAQYSMASSGIQMQQLQANRAFYWGEGGSWDNPTSESMWGLQDQLTASQHQSQMATFASQERSMGATWQYQQQTNSISRRQMDVSQDYQDYNLGYQAYMQNRQQQWAREDWGYQDTMSSLSFEWGLEDVNEAIRGATGRDRRNLIENRERMTTKYNLEQEQTGTVRDRQEEQWAMADERLQKQIEYQTELRQIEEERFSLNKEHQEEMHSIQVEDFQRSKEEYEEERQIREEMEELQREHQAEMMELQEQSIGIQAAAAAESMKVNQAIQDIVNDSKDKTDEIENALSHGSITETLDAMIELGITLGNLDPETARAVKELMKSINDAKGGAGSMKAFTDSVAGVSPFKIQQLINYTAMLK